MKAVQLKSTTVLVLALITISSACLRTCRFELCSPGTVSLHAESDIPLTSAICLNGKRLGVVNTGEARVERRSGTFRRISRINLFGLLQKYSPHFFKAYALIPLPGKPNRGSGIGHEVPQQNQKDFLGGRCVALPINEYQKLSDGIVVDNIHLRGKPRRNCVSFRVARKKPPVQSPVTEPTETPIFEPSIGPVMEPTDEPFGEPSLEPSAEPTVGPLMEPSAEPTVGPLMVPSAEPTVEPLIEPSAEPSIEPSIVPITEPETSLQPVPEFVDPGDTVEFPPTTELNEKTSFKFKITVSAESGSSKEDFYLLSDATGSMSSAISEAKEKFMEVVTARQAASTDVAFGVGFYRDEGEDPDFSNIQPITKNIAAVTTAIDSLVARGGGDFAEANLLALYEIAKKDEIGWREGSRKILVYFGDAVGHEPSCVDDLVLRRENVIEALNEKKITVVATSFSGDGLNLEPTQFNCPASEEAADVGQADAITKGTGGEVVDAEEQTALIESILSSVSGLSQSLEANTTDCEAQGVNVSFAPNLPLSIDAGKTVTVEETVKVSTCGSDNGSFECIVQFTLGGADIGTQTLKSSALSGC